MKARNFFDRKNELIDWLGELNDEYVLEQLVKVKDLNPVKNNKKVKIEESQPISEHWL